MSARTMTHPGARLGATTWGSRAVLGGALLAVVMVSTGLAADRPAIATGEVTANDVYVRSGPSTNHYTICKLDAGHRVTILSERGDWYEILPPPEAFSLISGQYVDTVDKKRGVVNGNNVRVRAGSALNDNKYTVQTMLSKGAEVTILGENPDGFLRIKPPSGATVWVSRSLIEPVPDERLRSDVTRDVPLPVEVEEAAGGESDAANGVDEGESVVAPTESEESETTEEAAAPHADRPSMSLTAVVEPTVWRVKLDKIDADMRAEAAKPLGSRQIEPLIERYREVAEQNEDEFAQRYARRRLEQANDMESLAAAIRQLRELDDKAGTARAEFMKERAALHGFDGRAPAAIDAVGELRISAVYSGANGPKRYRLVDPQSPGGKTIAYVEIPPDAGIDVDEFIGRQVGVRARSTHLLGGAVDPVPVYVAGELVLQKPAAPTPEVSAAAVRDAE